MASTYFKHHPLIDYQFEINNKLKTIPAKDLMIRTNLIREASKNQAAFYEYIWQDHDRADTVAEKYYGSADFWWVVLLSHQVYDPYYDLPIPRISFDEYLRRKYAHLEDKATASLVGVVSKSKERILNVDPIIWYLQETYLPNYPEDKPNEFVDLAHHYEDGDGDYIDLDTYKTLADDNKKIVSYYQWEERENDRRRRVKLLDRRYLTQFVIEQEDLIKNVVAGA